MSADFRPSGYLGADPLDKGGKEPEALTDQDISLINKVFKDPRRIPDSFWGYLISYLEANPPVLPVSQIFGFQQFTGLSNNSGGGNCTSSNPTDLGGPILTNIPDGVYFVWWGAEIYNVTAGAAGRMGVKVNAVDPGLSDSAVSGLYQTAINIARGREVTLNKINNTLACRYFNSNPGSETSVWSRPWMIALKTKNL